MFTELGREDVPDFPDDGTSNRQFFPIGRSSRIPLVGDFNSLQGVDIVVESSKACRGAFTMVINSKILNKWVLIWAIPVLANQCLLRLPPLLFKTPKVSL